MAQDALMRKLPVEQFRLEIHQLLDETFATHRGIYLDKGTSFFETVDSVTAAEASRAASDRSATIAAHVRHVSFYLQVLQRVIRGEPTDNIDWNEIWRQARPVSSEEWDAIRQELRAEHQNVVRLLEADKTWDGKDALGGALAIVVHTAYHLGAVRQALAVVRSREAQA